MTTPYTYLIGWTQYKKYYYGVRYASQCDPQDLWVSYFTSSKHVANFRKLHGEPDIVQVRRVFNSKQDAISWESRVLHRMSVTLSELWINQTNNKAIIYERTPDSIAKFVSKIKGRVSPFKGRSHTEQSKQINREKHLGVKTGRTSADFTEEWKEKISESNKGRVRLQSQEEKDNRSLKAISSGFNKNTVGKVWINNGVVNKRVTPETVSEYPGFVLGRLFISQLVQEEDISATSQHPT